MDLITGNKELSIYAKFLYTYLVEKDASLYTDEEGHLFTDFSRESVKELLDVENDKARAVLSELESAGLLERHQEVGKAAVIYPLIAR